MTNLLYSHSPSGALAVFDGIAQEILLVTHGAVIQAVCATQSRAAWLESSSGLMPLDAATRLAIRCAKDSMPPLRLALP